MTDREAMLSALRAYPLDDAGRLQYADWLYERGLEPVREAFIRMACRGNEVKYIPPAEGKFLDANYKELLPATYAMGRFARDAGKSDSFARDAGWRRVHYTRNGRHVRLSFALERPEVNGLMRWRRHWVGFWYLRGFAYKVTYYGAEHFNKLCGVAALDEPLAEHAMHDKLVPRPTAVPGERRVPDRGGRCRLAVDVYSHMVGAAFPLIEGADESYPGCKMFFGTAVFDNAGQCDFSYPGFREAYAAVVDRATAATTAAMTLYATTKGAVEAARAVDSPDGGSIIGVTEPPGDTASAVQG